MRTITIHVFTDGEPDPISGACPEAEVLGIQVADSDGRTDRRDYYDFRLAAPVQEHLLGEVTQLVDDLLSNHVAEAGSLQPALF
jgi:hypothetical protein